MTGVAMKLYFWSSSEFRVHIKRKAGQVDDCDAKVSVFMSYNMP